MPNVGTKRKERKKVNVGKKNKLIVELKMTVKNLLKWDDVT